jgi:sugar lactone lactonase YvrE
MGTIKKNNLHLLLFIVLFGFTACNHKAHDPKPVTVPPTDFTINVTPVPMVTTIAGNSSQAIVDGTGAAASFFNPRGISIDKSGNLYVISDFSEKIRKINPDGVVTTLNTQFAASATFSGLTHDAKGNLYISDDFVNVIYKVTPDNQVTLLAGNGDHGSYDQDGPGNAAGFSMPDFVTISKQGNFYVACTNFNTIRQITPNGDVTTLIGDDQSGLLHPHPAIKANISVVNALAVDSAGFLYIASDESHSIIKVDVANRTYSTYAGNGKQGTTDGKATTEASFHSFSAMTIDAKGNIFVAETKNLIRMISPAGIVTTIAGTGEPGYKDGEALKANFHYIRGMTVDALGDLYICDNGNFRIRKITFPKKQ